MADAGDDPVFPTTPRHLQMLEAVLSQADSLTGDSQETVEIREAARRLREELGWEDPHG